jgi:S1-C subfamily serine protease
MNARLLAFAVAAASGAHAAVFLGSDPALAFKPIADKFHGTVVDVRGLAAAPADGGEPALETVTHGTGTLLGNGLAVTTLHAVALPSPEGRMTPLQHVEVLVAEKGALPAQVIAGVADLDLAILELSAPGAALEAAPPASEAPAPGDPLLAMAVDDQAVIGVGIEVAAADGDLFLLRGKRMLDSRFWGGPLFDARGRLAGIILTSLGPSKAISVRAIQRVIEGRMRAAATPDSPGRH